MRILKNILIVILVLVALLFAVSFFLPSKMHIERSTVINAPAETIFDQVNNLKNSTKWSPWSKMDTAMKTTFTGPEAGVGASYSWDGDPRKVGKGTLTIIESVPNQKVVNSLDFGPNGTATAGYSIETAEGGNKVSWYMDSELKGAIEKYMGLLMSGFMEKVFDQGLADLKSLSESLPPPVKKPVIEEVKVAAINYLSIRDHATAENIGAKLGESYGKISEAIKAQKLEMSGAPFAIYLTESTSEWDLEAAIPTNKPGKPAGSVKPGVRQAGNAVIAHYFGDYSKMAGAYEALKEYMNSNSKKAVGPPWEEYITDPMMEKDTAKWATDIYFPVE